ncbi:MAG TPA: hypothetical protein PLM00_03550 [Spirochaetota bacterium]|nr:hypothetical protein [Spirochaetota bacterium]
MRYCIGLLILLVLLPGILSAAYNTSFIPTVVRQFSSPAEQKVVSELAKGNLTSYSLVEAGFIASGATSNESLARYTSRYRDLLAKIRQDLPLMDENPRSRAKKLFDLMFKHAMNAYQSEQTTLLEIFDAGHFNCVSSTLLYNLLCAEFGLKTRVAVVPGHVFSQVLPGGTTWIDAETTSSAGFNPLRERTNPGGEDRVFIEDRGQSGGKSFVDTGRLVALLYYNRGTLAHTQGRLSDAVALLMRALTIFPQHKESLENLLATMLEWAKKEGQTGNLDLAMRILTECDMALGSKNETQAMREGLVFNSAQAAAARGDFATAVRQIESWIASLPGQPTVQHKTALRGYILQWAQQCMQQGKYSEMVSLIDRAARSGQDSFVDSMRLHLITEAAKNLSRTRGYAQGYGFFNQHFPHSVENASIRQNRLHLYGLWITSEIESGKYEEAYVLNRSLLELYPSNQDVRNNAAWVVQRWMASVSSNTSPAQSLPVMYGMYQKYREPVFLDELVNGTLRESNRLLQIRQFEKAEVLVKKARDLGITGESGNKLAGMHRVILFNWSVFHAKRDEYMESIDIGKRALKLFPGDGALETNLVSFYYNAGLTFINTRQYDRASRLITEGLAEFPGNPNLLKLQQYLR